MPAASDTNVSCTHCGLPVPAGLVEPGAEVQFCCGGCKMVYETIHSCGLDQYYAIKKTVDEAQPSTVTDSSYRTYDDAAFQEAHVRPIDEQRSQVDLYLEGVHCAACVWLVERLPRVVPGVIEARLDFRRRVVRVIWTRETVALSRIGRSLDSLGYPSHPYRGGEMEAARVRENRRHLINIGVAGACAMNVMLIAFALYGGQFDGMGEQYRTMFRWAGFGLTLLALIWPGRTFFVGALSSFRTRVMHMDVPVALALTAGTVWGGWNAYRGVGEVYFESLTAVIFLLLVGRWIQHRQQRAAQDSIELLFTMTPTTARRIVKADAAEGSDAGEERVEEVAIEGLEAGDWVELRPGDSVPADGVIVRGASYFDCALLTGESVPVKRSEGEGLHAGTVNERARVVMEVKTTGAETRVGRLMRMVEEFAEDRAPVVRLADAVAHYFVFVVLSLALFTFGFWWFRMPSEPNVAIENAIALLIVTCPCALGLATPLALIAAIGRAASRGILIKGGAIIEQLSKTGVMYLDKTGTVTEGAMKLRVWEGDDSYKQVVAAVEMGMVHPVARALVEGLGLASSTDHVGQSGDSRVEWVKHVAGMGVEGEYTGEVLRVGSPRFVLEAMDENREWGEGFVERVTAEGWTPILVGAGSRVVAGAGVGDAIQEGAAASIAELQRLGFETQVLSGDHPKVAAAVGAQLGMAAGMVEGDATPERKAEVLAASIGKKKQGHIVVMVGDGVNDAAALSAADVGVAVHGGAEASLAAADVFLREPGLKPVVELVEGSRRATGVIKRNLMVSLGYNVITGSLAMAGLINPLLAAVLMPFSSLTVVTLSYRSRTFD